MDILILTISGILFSSAIIFLVDRVIHLKGKLRNNEIMLAVLRDENARALYLLKKHTERLAEANKQLNQSSAIMKKQVDLINQLNDAVNNQIASINSFTTYPQRLN